MITASAKPASMIGLRPILSDSPAKQDETPPVPSAKRHHPDHDPGGDRRHFQGLGQEEQRVKLSAVPHHGFAGGGAEQGRDCDLGVRPLAEGLAPSGRLDCLPSSTIFLNSGDLFQLQPDPDRNREQDRREQERNAPAPVAECGVAHIRCECRGSAATP